MNVMLLTVLLASLGPWGNRAQVEVVVVDDTTGKPLPGLGVTGSFEMEVKPVWQNTGDHNLVKATTDEEGRCRMSGVTDRGKVWCFVRPVPKEYYGWNGTEFVFKDRTLLGGWEPTDLVSTIRLDRVEHPVPLQVNEVPPRFRGNLAELPGAKCGYDLVEGEWMPPIGYGKVADLEIVCLPREQLGMGRNGRGDQAKAYRDTVAIRFPGEGNGIVEMHPRPGAGILIRTAPESGYEPEYRCWLERGLDLQWRTSTNRQRCFCFRIRTRKDENGQVIDAKYGKIYRDFYISTGKDRCICGAGFLYYLNPKSMDRNLEWNFDRDEIPRGSSINLP